MFDLRGRVAIVTGGNGGIGLGMAKGLAKAGARVVVAARNREKSSAAVRELQSLGSDALALTVDVTDERSVEALVTDTAQQCGCIDILVNNAGINIRKPAHELPIAQWQQVIDTNLTSAFVCSRAVYPHLKRAGGGKIINIGSMLSIFARQRAGLRASKGGIVDQALAVGWPATTSRSMRCCLADRYRPDAPGAPAIAGPERARAGAVALGALGHDRRFRGHRGVGQCRIGVHRHRDRRGWRLLTQV
jgi:NAD(P)-dependent dehydrogenase (short-subunit alcohol dehydrogenase family)